MSDALDRLTQAFEYLRFKGIFKTISESARQCGLTQPNLSAALKGDEKRLTKGNLKRFASAYSDYINEEWLLEGHGEMAKVDTKKFRPHIPLKVSAGYTDVSIGTAMETECESRVIIPGLADYDFTIEVQGDSMLPVLMNGDIIACQWLHDRASIAEDKIYVLDTKEGAVVKQIRIMNDGEVLCHSLNEKYGDFSIQGNDIAQLAKVVGVVRTF